MRTRPTDHRLRLAAVLLAFTLVPGVMSPATAEEAEGADPRWGFRWIPPTAYLDHWVFLPLGYYSSLDGVGIGLKARRLITIPVLSDLTRAQVDFLAQGRVYEQGHGEISLRAESFFAGDRWASVTRLDHSTRLREFWGVGPDLGDGGREQFRPGELRAYGEILRRFSRFRVGPRFEYHQYQYLEVEEGGLLDAADYPGVSSSGEYAVGLGVAADYDSRDDRYHPTAGWWIESLLMRFSRPGTDEPGFWNSYLDVRTYRALTEVDLLALQFFSYGVDSGAPVWRYAALGVGEHSRGYSRNRYLDRRMAAVQAEWRRRLFRRVGMQLFGGVALVTPAWPKARIDTLRPTLGAGLSVRIAALTDLPVRGELAIGDESVHGTLAIGYSF